MISAAVYQPKAEVSPTSSQIANPSLGVQMPVVIRLYLAEINSVPLCEDLPLNSYINIFEWFTYERDIWAHKYLGSSSFVVVTQLLSF